MKSSENKHYIKIKKKIVISGNKYSHVMIDISAEKCMGHRYEINKPSVMVP